MKRVVLVLLSFTAICWGQLTPAQKLEDFQNLAGLYAKRYAPVQWKIQAFDYNLFKIGPWLDRVQQSTSDVDFYETMAEYVASLNDAFGLFQPIRFRG